MYRSTRKNVSRPALRFVACLGVAMAMPAFAGQHGQDTFSSLFDNKATSFSELCKDLTDTSGAATGGSSKTGSSSGHVHASDGDAGRTHDGDWSRFFGGSGEHRHLFDGNPSPVPEPSGTTLVMLGIATIALWRTLRRR